MGFTADIIVWDLESRKLHKKLCLHKVMVQALDFSASGARLVSLGGPDDASLVLWDVASGEAICGSPTSGKFLETVRFLNLADDRLATAGQGARRVLSSLLPSAHQRVRPRMRGGASPLLTNAAVQHTSYAR